MDERQVPYIVFEGTQARSERTIKRLIIALIIVTSMMFASNVLWLYSWFQYDYESSEEIVTVDGHKGNANYIGNDGVITNGTDSSYEKNEKKD